MISAVKQTKIIIPSIIGRQEKQCSMANFTGLSVQKNVQPKIKNSEILFWGVFAAAIVVVNPKAVSIPVSSKLKQEFEEIYDRAWEDVNKDAKQSKIKMEKPKIKFYFNTSSDECAGYYSGINAVRINLYMFNACEYVAYKDKKFASRGHIPFFSLKEMEKLKKDGLIDDSWTVRKVNHAEKMFYWNYVISHELKHCEQSHLILNNPKFGSDFLLGDAVAKSKELHPILPESFIRLLAIKNNPYWSKFKADKNNNNLNLKLHTIYKDNQFDFTAEDFAKNQAKYSYKEARENPDKYILNLLEVDANSFATNYIKLHKDIQTGCRKEIAELIMTIQEKDNSKNMDKFVNTKIKNAA